MTGRRRSLHGCERLGEAQIVLAEARVRAQLVVRDDDSDRPSAHEAARTAPVERPEVDGSPAGSTSGSSSSESMRSLRPRSSTRPAFDPPSASPCRRRPLGLRLRPPRPAGRRRPGARSTTSRASISSRSRRATRSSSGASSSSDESALPISFKDSSCSRPRVARLVQTRVLDRHGGLRGEELRRAPVLVGEVAPALFLGEIEVSVGHAPQQDRQPRGTSSSADGSAEIRPSADRPQGRGAGAAARLGSVPRESRGRAAGRRSPLRAPRRSRSSRIARASGRLRSITPRAA